MKRLTFFSVALGLAALCCPTLSSTAQAQTGISVVSNSPEDSVAIEETTAKLGAAFRRGDAKAVLSLLSPTFELGRYQYQKRDFAWMSRFLPLEFKRTTFTKFDVEARGEHVEGDLATVTGDFGFAGRMSAQNDYIGLWRKIRVGWRLERADNLFNSLLPFESVPPSTIIAPAPSTPSVVSGTSLPLQEPSFVLEQPYGDAVRSLNFSPNGEVITTRCGSSVLHLSSAKNGALLKAVASPFVFAFAYAPDGSLVIEDSDEVHFLNGSSGALMSTLPLPGIIASLCVSPDSRTLAVKVGDFVQLWDIASKRRVKSLGNAGNALGPVQFSADGRTLAILTPLGVELWNVKEGTKAQSLGGVNAWILDDGKTVVTVSYPVLRYRTIGSDAVVQETKIPSEVPAPGNSIYQNEKVRMFFFPTDEVTVAPNGKIAARVYSDGTIGVWNTETGTIFRVLRGFQIEPGTHSSTGLTKNVSAFAFSPDSQTLAVGSESGEAAVWDVSQTPASVR